MRVDIKEMITTADEDLELAKLALTNGHFRMSAFHAQQAVEKYIKALLILEIGWFPHTHNISLLLEKTKEKNTLERFGVDILTKYYTETRYPPLIEVSGKEAREAVEIAEKVKDFVEKKIKVSQ